MTAGILLCFAALLVLAVFLAQRGVASSLTPLAAVCFTVLWFSLGGCFGLLRAAGWLYFAMVAAAAGYLAYRFGCKKDKWPHLGFGFWFFALAGVVIITLFWVRQPMFLTWDEFSTWGTSAKLMKLYDELYVTAPVGWPWVASQPPTVMAFTYFMQFFGGEFAEWQMYAAIDILEFACIAALLRPFEKKNIDLAFPLCTAALLAPFLFTHYAEPLKLSAVYLDSLADVPMAFLFAGALAAYYAGGRKSLADMLPVCLALAALTLTKEPVGVALALVVAVLVLIDLLFEKREEKIGGARRAKRALGHFGMCAGAAVAAYAGWAAYLSAVRGVQAGNLGGGGDVGMLEMPLRFVQDALHPENNARFLPVLFGTAEQPGMLRLFASSRVTLLGSGLVVMGIVLALALLAALITKDKALRRRCLLFGIFEALGFAAYYLFLAMYYLYIFTNEQTFASYERYVYPYYIGVFLVAAVLLGMAARDSRFIIEGRAAVLALCVLMLLQFVRYIPISYSVIGFSTQEFEARRDFAADVQGITDRLEEDGKTFIVSTEDGGLRWFMYCYEFLPYQVDYSYGGGSVDDHFVVNDKQADGSVDRLLVSAGEWAAYLIENECDTVFIDEAGSGFADVYGGLFADGMDGYFAGETNLYDVQVRDCEVLLVPAA